MTKHPVLDDCTRDASIIGHADSPEAAADVYRTYMADRAILGEGETLQVPTFAWRNPHGADFREIGADEISAGFYEPIWS
jgi:hypothetical protein